MVVYRCAKMHFLKLPVVALPRTPFICHRQQSFSSHLQVPLSLDCLNNRKREVRLYFSFSMVRVTVFALAKVPTSLIKHKCVRKEASTLSLKTVHRTVFLTVAFKSRYRFAGIIKRPNTYVLGLFMVRVTGLEPVRQRHTPLKRACLPIPAHSHINFLQQ